MRRPFVILVTLVLITSVTYIYRAAQPKQYSSSIWHYQLQNADFNALLALDVDYVVVDPDDANLSRSELDVLRQSGKRVLAYLSIGEAEEYREYWRGWRPGCPDFIAEENPEWSGNYKVKFWDERWQSIVLDRVRKIVWAGYSGRTWTSWTRTSTGRKEVSPTRRNAWWTLCA